MTPGNWYWVVWFCGGFLIPEAIALLSRGRIPTLSATFIKVTHSIPRWADYSLTAATAGLLAWLLFGHWIGRHLDGVGLGWMERVAILGGAIWGALAARRRRRKSA